MSSILRGSFSWSGLNDIINTENHLSGLRGREEDTSLELERLVDSKLRHITNSTVIAIRIRKVIVPHTYQCRRECCPCSARL